MNKLIALNAVALGTLVACTDVPHYEAGLIVGQMVEAQVANKSVIYDPAEGQAADVLGIGIQPAIKTYTTRRGRPEAVQQAIQHVSSGTR